MSFITETTDLGSPDRKFNKIYAKELVNGIVATTQTAGDNSNKVATTAYVDNATGNIQGHYVGEFIAMSCTADYVPEGCIPADGAEYSKSQFSTVWSDYLIATTPLLPTCSYADYATAISTYGQCNKWAIDTVNEKFKVPTIKDGAMLQQAKSDSELGKAYNAGLPNITGEWNNSYQPVGGTGDFGAAYTEVVKQNYGEQSASNVIHHNLKFDASRSNAIYGNSTTVQPVSVTVRYFVCVASGSVNQSMIDWSAYMSALQGKADKDRVYDLYDDFTIIYPNGGTAESPANITINSRYVMNNPFPGYHVDCVVEVMVDGMWGTPNLIYESGMQGTCVAMLDDNEIVVKTGSTYIMGMPATAGTPFPSGGNLTSAPCRVKVWKIGKVANA